MRRRAGVALLGVASVGVVAAVGYGVLSGGDLRLPFTQRDGCTATVGGHRVDVSVEQAENASLITAISVQRGLPARAASIALATAYQESDLANIDYGDRDSLGLFQQRPSQGWGTEAEVLDPVYATNAFYDALMGLDDYRGLEITEAAQAVQRSGFPDAYADHEDDARALASALTGNSPRAFTCTMPGEADSTDASLVDTGLTERADVVRRDVEDVFGDVSLGGYAPGGVSDGHQEGSAHYEGRAIDMFVRPINTVNTMRGWAMAHYYVAQSERLGVATVIFDGRIWTARRSSQGWRDYSVDTSGRSAETAAILEHRDHVHVDVFD